MIDRELVTRKIVHIGGDRIVHEYDEIEPEKVFGAIRSALADLPVYLKAVLSFIG